MNRVKKILSTFVTILKSHRWLLIIVFFAFLLLRNYHQLFLVDLNDGIGAKIYLSQHGYDINSIKGYLKDFAFSNYNQHFIPIWFCIYFILCFFDLNPVILGLITCFSAALFCYLLFETIIYYSKSKDITYAFLITLMFISTIMFIEILAWKWMLSLLLSSLGFLVCLKLIHNLKKWYLALYLISLSIMVWCFSPSIILGWYLVLYYFIYNMLERKRIINLPLVLSIAILSLASLVLVITSEHVSKLNSVFILTNTPSILVLTIFSGFMELLGIYKFVQISLPLIGLSIVPGVVVIITFCNRIILKGREFLPIKNYALITSMGLAYLSLVILVLLRIMPSYGLQFTQDPSNYITGNRYLFVFCIPLILILIYPLEKLFGKLSNFTRYTLILSVVLLGFIISFSYAGVDSFINSKDRIYFYNQTAKMLRVVEQENLILPNTVSTILFVNQDIDLKTGIYYRNEAKLHKPIFKKPDQMEPGECNRLRNNQEVSRWLDSYSKEWCNIPK